MAFNIFESDPESKPKPRVTYANDLVGRLHSGYAEGGKPKALTEWRFTTDDPSTGASVAQLYGGSADEFETAGDNNIQVFTDKDSIEVILEGPKSIYADGKLWINGQLMHHCDGEKFLSPDEKKGAACHCPPTLAERKQAAREYRGPSPSIEVTFRLADDPELGKFVFKTSAWSLMTVLHETTDALSHITGEALATLSLEGVSFVAKNGPMKGKTVSYTMPVIEVKGSYNDAIADDA